MLYHDFALFGIKNYARIFLLSFWCSCRFNAVVINLRFHYFKIYVHTLIVREPVLKKLFLIYRPILLFEMSKRLPQIVVL